MNSLRKRSATQDFKAGGKRQVARAHVSPQKKVKVGTVLSAHVLRDAKVAAAAEGRPLSALIEDALREYLCRGAGGVSAVEGTRGLFGLTAKQLAEVINADLYDT